MLVAVSTVYSLNSALREIDPLRVCLAIAEKDDRVLRGHARSGHHRLFRGQRRLRRINRGGIVRNAFSHVCFVHEGSVEVPVPVFPFRAMPLGEAVKQPTLFPEAVPPYPTAWTREELAFNPPVEVLVGE